MPTRNPADVAARWAQNLSGATSKIQAGVEAVTVAPGQAAARQKGAYVQGVTASQDKWATNVAAVSAQSWKDSTINKGLPRIASGAQAAQGKFANFMVKLLPYIDSGVQSLPARGSLDANIARSTAWIRYMSQFKNQ